VLRVVHGTSEPKPVQPNESLALLHHNQLLEGYFQSHVIRNLSPNTLAATRRHLIGWFEAQGKDRRILLTWDAMKPTDGRKRIVDYGKTLIEAELANQTIRKYLGTLKSYFEFVLEHPVVFDQQGNAQRIIGLYGTLEQPVSEYDIPQHSYDACDGPDGVPMDPARLHEFYSMLRKHYLTSGSHLRKISGLLSGRSTCELMFCIRSLLFFFFQGI